MKLSDLRPCDHCGGQIQPFFYEVTVNVAVLDRSAIEQTASLARMFASGNPWGVNDSHLRVAEAMSPAPSVVKTDPHLETVVFLCNKCYTSNVLLPLAVEKSQHVTKSEQKELIR